MVPNPDYYAAFMWKQLMLDNVLQVEVDSSTSSVQVYATASPSLDQLTILVVNSMVNNQVEISIQGILSTKQQQDQQQLSKETMINRYTVTAGDDEASSEKGLTSSTIKVNGKLFKADPETGTVPALESVAMVVTKEELLTNGLVLPALSYTCNNKEMIGNDSHVLLQ